MRPIATAGMGGLALHVRELGAGEGVEIWLDAEPGVPETGICVATGDTVREALGDAVQMLSAAAAAAMVAR